MAPNVTDFLGIAQRVASEHPDTFWAPPPDMLGTIAKGMLVKVCDVEHSERFWTEVIDKRGKMVTATVANETMRWAHGTLIQFHERCAYDVVSPAAMAKHALGWELQMAGMLYPPSPEEQQARMIVRVIEKHGDIFGTGKEEPAGEPVAPETVIAWFQADASRLEGTGLTADDLGLIHVRSEEDLFHEGVAMGQIPERARHLARLFYNTPLNLVLAPSRVAEIYNMKD